MPERKKTVRSRRADSNSADAGFESIGRLLWSEQPADVRQGLELLASVADETFWERLATKVAVDPTTGRIGYDDSLMREYRPADSPGFPKPHVEFRDEVAFRAALVTGRLQGLRTLEVHSHTLRALGDMSPLISLENLSLSFCIALTTLEGIGALVNLRNLDVSSCDDLVSIDAVSSLPALEALDVSLCLQLTTLRGVGELRTLQRLSCRSCHSLTHFADVWRATTLRELNLSRCGELTSLAGIDQLVALRTLEVDDCRSLVDIEALGSLTHLQSLKMDIGWMGDDAVERLDGSVSIDWAF